jgi:glutamine synthetase
MITKFDSNKDSILSKAIKEFKNSNSIQVKIGCELEFFLFANSNFKEIPAKDFANYLHNLNKILISKFSLITEVKKEQGDGQIEVIYNCDFDLEKLSQEVELSKEEIINFAKKHNLFASFQSLPIASDCSSSLQFNISIHHQNGDFLEDNNKFNAVIFGLLCKANSFLIFQAPKKEDYQRFDLEINKSLFKKGKYTAPINLSFGNNNRTCAIRIKNNQIIEYRIPSPNCQIQLVISAILLIINELKNSNLSDEEMLKLTKMRVFGNAFDDNYNYLQPILKSFLQAKEAFELKENFIAKKMTSYFC